MRNTLALVPGLVMLLSPHLSAQSIDPAALKSLQIRPEVAVTTSQHNRALTGALDVNVQLANLTATTNFFVKRVELRMPAEFIAARQGEAAAPSDSLSFSVNQLLNPGQQRLVSFQVPAGRLRWFAPGLQLLSFTPGEYDIRVVTTFQVPPDPFTQIMDVSKVRLEAPLAALIWGGWIGSALLAAFIGTYRGIRKAPSTPLRRAVTEAIGLALAGGVCATVTIILLQRIKASDLPVTVEITDFYGGVVLGLFSYKLGDWLYSQLFKEEDEVRRAEREVKKAKAQMQQQSP